MFFIIMLSTAALGAASLKPPGWSGYLPLTLGRTRPRMDAAWDRVVASRVGRGPWDALIPQWRALPLRERYFFLFSFLFLFLFFFFSSRCNAINQYVNRRVIYTRDTMRSDGVADYWKNAATTLAEKRGDCEDYSIAKMQLLHAAGTPYDQMFMYVVKDLVARADHAFLGVRDGDVAYTLDNFSMLMANTFNLIDLKPIFTYGKQGGRTRRWTWGVAAGSSRSNGASPRVPAQQPPRQMSALERMRQEQGARQ